MRWKGSQEGLEGAASFRKRLAMTSVVAGGRDREERPGRVEAANLEKSWEAVTEEDGTGGSEFVGVIVEGKDNPAAEGATGMWDGVGETCGGRTGDGGRGAPGWGQEEVEKIGRGVKHREVECNEESRVREGGDRAFRRASNRRGDEAGGGRNSTRVGRPGSRC
jgi:hypothetical protein